MKKSITISIAVILILFAGIIIFVRTQRATIPQPSNDEFIQAITDKFPDFIDDDDPVIAVDSVSRHNYKWYIVTIKSLSKVEVFIPVKVVVLDEGDSLSVILGPDTYFTEAEIALHNLPESAILELQES